MSSQKHPQSGSDRSRKSPAQQPNHPKTKENRAKDNGKSQCNVDAPICPPRISFGVELEFFVAEGPMGEDPDLAIADKIPPKFVGKHEDSVYHAIAELLCEHQIDAYVRSSECEKHLDNAKWTVTQDSSLEAKDEEGSGYNWEGVEITSPACYACNEAFALIKVVVRLITSHFRTRVNTTCGFRVYVGNGPYRLDMQTARNFAALTWAAEPKLSVLHCPSRAMGGFSQSIRRLNTCALARGIDASDAYADVVTNTFCSYIWMSRYQGRARKIGERPVASVHNLFHRIVNQEQDESGEWLEPQWEDDDSDYEQETSKPFSRPKKAPGRRVKSVRLLEELKRCPPIPSEEALRKMDDNKMSDGPPQIDFTLPEAIRNRLRDHEENMPSTDVTAPTAPTALKLERPRKPIRDRHGAKATQLSLDEILRDETITDRTAPARWDWSPEPPKGNYLTDLINEKRPARTGTWSGVAEVLACDIGTHQVAYLMGGSRNYTDNWEGQQRHHLSVLPTMSVLVGNPYMTIESRAAGGSLDGEWIETWARIQCRLMAFAHDAEPAEFMRVIGLLGDDDDGRAEAQYDVVDLLEDIGCYAEARVCEERVGRGEEAYFDNMLLKKACVPLEEEGEEEEEDDDDEVNTYTVF